MPAGGEDAARAFYARRSASRRSPSRRSWPAGEAAGSRLARCVSTSVWTRTSGRRGKAHPALVVARPARTGRAGRTGNHVGRRAPRRRAGLVYDPFGNRIELVEPDCAGSATRTSPRSCGAWQMLARRGRCSPASPSCRRRFGASRVTVRRALELLRDEGLIAARQGFGWFVAAEPVRQRLEHLGTIEDQLATSGRRAERKVLSSPSSRLPRRSGCCSSCDYRSGAAGAAGQPGRWRALRHRDRVVPCRDRARPVARRRRATPVLRAAGPPPPRRDPDDRRRCRDPAEASCSRVPVGAPMLRCRRVTTDTAGRPVLISEHVFPAHRTEFVVDLPLAEPSLTPAGLRLIR